MGIESLSRRYEHSGWKYAQHYFFLHAIRPKLNLKDTDIQRILHILKKVGVKELHRQASMEQVILALAVFIIEERGHPVPLDRYSILKEYGVDYKLYTTVLRNLLQYYRARTPTVRG